MVSAGPAVGTISQSPGDLRCRARFPGFATMSNRQTGQRRLVARRFRQVCNVDATVMKGLPTSGSPRADDGASDRERGGDGRTRPVPQTARVDPQPG